MLQFDNLPSCPEDEDYLKLIEYWSDRPLRNLVNAYVARLEGNRRLILFYNRDGYAGELVTRMEEIGRFILGVRAKIRDYLRVLENHSYQAIDLPPEMRDVPPDALMQRLGALSTSTAASPYPMVTIPLADRLHGIDGSVPQPHLLAWLLPPAAPETRRPASSIPTLPTKRRHYNERAMQKRKTKQNAKYGDKSVLSFHYLRIKYGHETELPRHEEDSSEEEDQMDDEEMEEEGKPDD